MTDNEPGATAADALDLATAEQISGALTQIARANPAGVIKPTPREAIGGGLLSVRFAGDHMVCHYDPATGDPQAWDRELSDDLGAETAALVRYEPARTAPADLVALFEQIVRRQWHPRASSTALAAAINWEREVIDVTLGVAATDEIATTLIALVGDRAVVTTGARFSRR